MLTFALTAANIVAHLLALVSGLMVLHKFGPQMQTISLFHTFNVKCLWDSYIGRRVWVICGTVFGSLIMLLTTFAHLGDGGEAFRSVIVEIAFGILATFYHFDTLKDKRGR